MNEEQGFKDFLISQSVDIPVLNFIINIVIAGFLAYVLGLIYIKYGRALSNRRSFANNFLLLTVATMLIITIVKSSLALSLGLVGALSIVRFRSAIKEPEELTYLFIAIAIGLGFGADQRLITLIGFIVITILIWIKHYSTKRNNENQNLFLTVYNNGGNKIELNQIVNALRKYCTMVNIKRFDETNDNLEASFLIELDDFDKLDEAKTSLLALNEGMKVSFLDNKGVST
ncbi:DUF4956 domain-containing protein [Fulvivirgaceae bacterium BMA12]|uniref:DUF4956 domain-containing protein n=1 Tax=Agaribacillus aureus TaxID=3051825 RepID=A0ABT8L1G6_9BACT|nr:DUF4956 domain-containing protein [Fulvivirgaceae bacterium BMA12]